METHQKSILEYNDVRNAIDYAKEETRNEDMNLVVTSAYQIGLPLQQIQAITKLGLRDIKKILNPYN